MTSCKKLRSELLKIASDCFPTGAIRSQQSARPLSSLPMTRRSRSCSSPGERVLPGLKEPARGARPRSSSAPMALVQHNIRRNGEVRTVAAASAGPRLPCIAT